MLLLPDARILSSLGGVVLLIFISAFLSSYPFGGMLQGVEWLTYLLLFLLVTQTCRREKEGREWSLFLLYGGLLACLIGLFFLVIDESSGRKMASTFYQSDVFAGYLLLIIPLAVSLFLHASSKRDLVIFGSTAVLFLVSLLFTFSRGAWLSLLLAAPLLIWGGIMGGDRNSMLRRVLLTGVLCFVTVLLVVWMGRGLSRGATSGQSPSTGQLSGTQPPKGGSLLQNLLSRFSTSFRVTERSTAARLSFWAGAVQMIREHPLTGFGPEAFGRRFPRYQQHFYFYSKYPHNFYLQLAAENGIPALLLWLLLLTFLLLTAAQLRKARGVVSHPFGIGESGTVQVGTSPAKATGTRESGSSLFPVFLGLSGGFAASSIHHFLDVDMNFSRFAYQFFAVMALMVCTGRIVANGKIPFFKLSLLRILIPLFLLVPALFTVRLFLADHALALSRFLEGRGKDQEAMVQAVRSTDLVPFYPVPLQSRAYLHEVIFQKSRDPAELLKAVALARQVASLDPEKASHHRYLARLLVLIGDRMGSLQALKQSILLDPVNYPGACNDLAELFMQEGNLKMAGRLFRLVTFQYPAREIEKLHGFRREEFQIPLASAYLGLTKILIAQGEDRKAGEALSGAEVLLPPSSPQIALYRGILAFRKKHYLESLQDLRQAQKDRSFEVDSLYVQALSLWRLGREEEAMDSLHRVISITPSHLESILLLGDMYLFRGRRKRAVELWREAAKLAPGDGRVKRRLSGAPVPPP